MKVSLKTAGIVALGLCLILVVGMAVACGAKDDATGGTGLVGVWHTSELQQTIEFTADGTMIVTSDVQEGVFEFEYTIEGNEVVVTSGDEELGRSAFSVDGDSLSLADSETGEPVAYERQK